MFTKITTSVSLILTSVSAAALTATPASAQIPNIPIPFVQCVKNVFGTGIVAKVRWYDPTKVTYTAGRTFDDLNTKIDERIGKIEPMPYAPLPREENIAVGQQSCNTGMTGQQLPKLALVSVYGSGIVNEAISISVATVVGVVGGVACVAATAGSTCPAVAAAATAIATGSVSLVAMGIPDAKDVFYAGSPGMLEISGQAWNPIAIDKTLGKARLKYSAEVDFCHSTLVDTNTGNNITVSFMSGNSVVASQTIKGSVSDCAALSKGYLTAYTNTDRVVDGVEISTDGGDAMMIDQVQAYRDGTKFIWDGRNNGGGWCLSTDVNDYQGGWESISAGCQSKYTFRNPA